MFHERRNDFETMTPQPADPGLWFGRTPWLTGLVLIGLLALRLEAFVAFNDHAPGLYTHPNTTRYSPGDTGPLKDIGNASPTPVRVAVIASSFTAGSVQGHPLRGTPASVVFDGYVDFSGNPDPGLELDSSGDSVTYEFSGLDPNRRYNFQGFAMRGHWGYSNRWTLVELAGARGNVPKHTDGVRTIAQITTLTPQQALLCTGDNNAGDLVWWEEIEPSADGRFSVSCKRYGAAVPGFGSAGATAYALTGFRLESTPSYTGRRELPPLAQRLTPDRFDGIEHVFLIMMENHDWSTILGSPECPYINKVLLPQSSWANNYWAVPGLHPSEPNYLWLVTGTNFNIRTDELPKINHQASTQTLFHQLDAAGISWKSYQEDISGNDIPDTNSGQYVARHNPPMFFDSLRTQLAYVTNHIRPFAELAQDLKNNRAPRFCFISPNMTNIMHNLASGSSSTRRQGDDWLAAQTPAILNSAAFKKAGVLFIVWDEGSNDNDNPVGMIAVSPFAKAGGYHNSRFYTHSSWLRTVQDIFHLQPYLGDALFAESFIDLFESPRLELLPSIQNALGWNLRLSGLRPAARYTLEGSTTLQPADWVRWLEWSPTNTTTDLFVPATEQPAERGFLRLRRHVGDAAQ